MKKEIDEILRTESKIAEEKQKTLEKASRIKAESDKELALREKDIQNSNREKIQNDLTQFRKDLDKENLRRIEDFQKEVITFERIDSDLIDKVVDKLNTKICHSEF